MTKHFECPLRMFEYPVSTPTTNPHAATTWAETPQFDLMTLLICMDPASPDFGTIPSPFYKAGLSVLVVETGPEPFVTVDALRSFCTFLKTRAARPQHGPWNSSTASKAGPVGDGEDVTVRED